jgi:hypothetical protein
MAWCEMSEPTDRELRLTAVLYARLGVIEHLKQTSRLPETIGGLWNCIPARHVIAERGTDPVLSDEEQLVYEAILREGRRPGGCVRVVAEK